MTVLDFEDQRWFLLAKGDCLLLEVCCSHSAVDYSCLIELNADELHRYREEGRASLDRLGEIVHISAPGVIGSRSGFRERNVRNTFGVEVDAAIRNFLS